MRVTWGVARLSLGLDRRHALKSTPISKSRARRNRQRLRANDSIGSDSAAPPRPWSAHLRAESLPIESYR